MSAEEEKMKGPLAGTLGQIFTELGGGPKKRNARLADVWARTAGPALAGRTRAYFSNQTVRVVADNSALAFELESQYGRAILKRLQNEFGESEVEKVWFSVGDTAAKK